MKTVEPHGMTPTSKFQKRSKCCMETESYCVVFVFFSLFFFFVFFLVCQNFPKFTSKKQQNSSLQGLVVKSLVWLCEMFNVFVLVAHNSGTP